MLEANLAMRLSPAGMVLREEGVSPHNWNRIFAHIRAGAVTK